MDNKDINKELVIPVMHCFNDNYAIPASVAFLSMLENANKNYFYKLYVLHSDITLQNQKILMSIISRFKNASLEFVNMNNKFKDLFEQTNSKGHYTKEMFYKFCAPSLFPQYDRIIITDVDVVYCGDISEEFVKFKDDEENYLAGIRGVMKKGGHIETIYKQIYSDFTEEEREKLLTGAGYWIFNLKKMREDNCEEKFYNFAIKNSYRIKQPEQDTVNIICAPFIKLLPINSMVCTYAYDTYKTKEDMKQDVFNSADEIAYALDHPIQLHYATSVKPWNSIDCTKSNVWFEYIAKTPYLRDVLSYFKGILPKSNYYLFNLIRAVKIDQNKVKLFGCIPLNKR